MYISYELNKEHNFPADKIEYLNIMKFFPFERLHLFLQGFTGHSSINGCSL